MFKKIFIRVLLVCLIFGSLSLGAPAVNAAPIYPGRVSINFDDGLLSTHTLAAPIMAAYGFKGTAYVYTEPQNEKEPGYYDEFMSWDNVVSLQNDFGWEIGAHGYTHTDLTTMRLAAAKKEINRSRTDLVNHGLRVESFASPYGAYNNNLTEYIRQFFSSHRTAWNLSNTWPVEDYYLKARHVLPTTPASTVQSWIDAAHANGEWLILLFHSLTEGAPAADSDDYNVNDFKSILDHIQSSGLPVMTTTEALHSWGHGDNLIPNGSFESGTLPNADNWVRSATNGVNVVANDKGVYPEPKRSVVITGAKKQRSISTKEIPVEAGTPYRIKAFYRVSNYQAGDSTVWVSEFNENYAYIGGQWLGGLNYNFVGTRYFDYTPSPDAKYMELFFLTHDNAKMKFEVDGVEMKTI